MRSPQSTPTDAERNGYCVLRCQFDMLKAHRQGASARLERQIKDAKNEGDELREGDFMTLMREVERIVKLTKAIKEIEKLLFAETVSLGLVTVN